jgi:hypothetical protein
MIVTRQLGTTVAVQRASIASSRSFLAPMLQKIPVTSSLEKQASDGMAALKNYQQERAEWREARIERREAGLRNIPQLYILAYFACRRKYRNFSRWRDALYSSAGTQFADRILKKSEGCPAISKYTDNEIGFIASATDEWEMIGGGTRFQPNPLYSDWNPASGKVGVALDSAGKPYPVWDSNVSRPHEYAWTLLRDGMNPGDTYKAFSTKIARPGEFDLVSVINDLGLTGLYYYCEAVPAVRLLAQLNNIAPDWPVTAVWVQKLAPLIYAHVTQEQLDAWANAYTFSNPLIRAGDMRSLAASITAAVNDASNDTPNMPKVGGITSSPWFWVLLIGGAAAGGVWYYRRRKNGGGK